MTGKIALKRTLSLPMMVLYGLGTTIGAGIYALIGEVAGIAGYFSPISFLIASMLAGFTALSFAELCGRYPRAAGAALYVNKGFHSIKLSTLVGLLVVLAGVVSAAALLNGFVNQLQTFITVDRFAAIMILCVVLGTVALWGIAESVMAAGLITLIEIGGLCIVIAVSGDALASLPSRWQDLIPDADSSVWNGIFIGSLLAFYAFIGFEDMVDVAEEVREVKHNLPLAILLTLVITVLLYMTLMTSAVLSMPPSVLNQSPAPLATLFEFHTGTSGTVIVLIGLFAVINGALIQLIMASRVLYGLSFRGQLPAWFHYVNLRTRTPTHATIFATLSITLLALAGTLVTLAKATSIVMLSIFALVNLSLWRIKAQEPHVSEGLNMPRWISLVGFLVSIGFVGRELLALLL